MTFMYADRTLVKTGKIWYRDGTCQLERIAVKDQGMYSYLSNKVFVFVKYDNTNVNEAIVALFPHCPNECR